MPSIFPHGGTEAGRIDHGTGRQDGASGRWTMFQTGLAGLARGYVMLILHANGDFGGAMTLPRVDVKSKQVNVAWTIALYSSDLFRNGHVVHENSTSTPKPSPRAHLVHLRGFAAHGRFDCERRAFIGIIV